MKECTTPQAAVEESEAACLRGLKKACPVESEKTAGVFAVQKTRLVPLTYLGLLGSIPGMLVDTPNDQATRCRLILFQTVSEHRTSAVCRLGAGLAERSRQDDTDLAQCSPFAPAGHLPDGLPHARWLEPDTSG
jgi:hypothetical protein